MLRFHVATEIFESAITAWANARLNPLPHVVMARAQLFALNPMMIALQDGRAALGVDSQLFFPLAL
jgi:hypothetical protein